MHESRVRSAVIVSDSAFSVVKTSLYTRKMWRCYIVLANDSALRAVDIAVHAECALLFSTVVLEPW